ncbi:MAG TPA: primosomal protein N', partial [Armatimonadetes bacterium]|nr:primosomal protein N' [Armatimonadota bacterium]
MEGQQVTTAMKRFAIVCVDNRASAVDKPLTYAIPESLAGEITIGSPVLVPLQRQWISGYVIDITDDADLPPERIKPIARTLWHQPLFDAELLKLAKWVSSYYHCPLFEALRLIVPPGWQQQIEERVEVIDIQSAQDWLEKRKRRAPKQTALLEYLLQADEPVRMRDLRKQFGSGAMRIIQRLRDASLVRLSRTEKAHLPALIKRQAALLTEAGKEALGSSTDGVRLTDRQRSLLHRLQQVPIPVPLMQLEREGWARSTAQSLAARGLIDIVEVAIPRTGELGAEGFETAPEGLVLTDEQRRAIECIINSVQKRTFNVIVLHGVTASGKTEVYLRAIQHVMNDGEQAILLVPEIALTAQAAAIFRYRLGERVAILHSALGHGARFEEWTRILNDEVDVVIGPRSAAFAPCRRLRLLIIDEEQDESYKQEAMPRYHGRDVALMRAKWANATVVLGSATPSVETYYKALTQRYHLIQLRKRIDDRPLPIIRIIDLREASHRRSPWLSDPLVNAIEQRLNAGEQVILFLNRRGFAAFLLCTDCGFVETCPNCAVSLTLHRRHAQLVCHHCNWAMPVPVACRACGSSMIAMRGAGTERIEEEVVNLFPNVRVLRMDRDTTQRRGAHARILSSFRKGEADILVGTQMVTKGLDFPNVTLVGVLNADVGLNFPDYRAAERTFQLLAQVAGRAGRGERPGEVYIQTYNPEHYAIRAAAQHSYEGFFQHELRQRREPP